MDYVCACGKSYKNQPHLSRHGNGGPGRKACPIYQERKGRGEALNVAVNKNTRAAGSLLVQATQNGDNNTTIGIQNNNDNSVINNVININGFGKEDISMLTREVLDQLFTAPKSSLVRLFEKIWESPENHNMRNTDPSRPMLRVYDGEEWKRMDKKRTLNSLIGQLQEIWRKYVKDNKIHIHRLRDDEFYNRVYKIDQLMLQMERIKLNGVIVSNS